MSLKTSMRIVKMEMCWAILINYIKLIYSHQFIHQFLNYSFIYFRKPLLKKPMKEAKRKDEGRDKLTHFLVAQFIIAISI